MARRTALPFALLLLACSTGGSSVPLRFSAEPTGIDRPDLIIGEFGIDGGAVVDGDTIRVMELADSLRLLGIDTEETFKLEADRRAAAYDWRGYLASKVAAGSKPVKFGTPLGEEAKRFARQFFAGVERVRLERDHTRETRGRYGRLLAYVFAERDGEWVNYNVEAVRAGMSPYFMKYGYSRRFHDRFEKAMAEARAARRGIWEPGARCYPDYNDRLAWWRARAVLVREFARTADIHPDHVLLTHSDALARIERRLGSEVVLFSTVARIVELPRGRRIVRLARKKGDDFPVVFESDEVFAGTPIADFESEYVEIRGEVEVYEHRGSGKETLQVTVQHPSQVTAVRVWPPG